MIKEKAARKSTAARNDKEQAPFVRGKTDDPSIKELRDRRTKDIDFSMQADKPFSYRVAEWITTALMGLFIALFRIAPGQATGKPVFDGIASILIGVLPGVTAIWLAYEKKGLLIEESASKEVRHSIFEMVQQTDAVELVNEVLTMHMGPDYIPVNLSASRCTQHKMPFPGPCWKHR